VLVKKKSYRKKKKFYVTVIWTWWRPISHAQNKRSQIILLKHSDISWPLLIAQWMWEKPNSTEPTKTTFNYKRKHYEVLFNCFNPEAVHYCITRSTALLA